MLAPQSGGVLILEALRRQEEAGLVGDAQLGQERELIPVDPLAYDPAIPHLGEQRALHPHSSPGRGEGHKKRPPSARASCGRRAYSSKPYEAFLRGAP